MVENTNLIMNSKKAWATICRLGAENVFPPVGTTVAADQIANQLLSKVEEWNTEGHPVSTTKQSFQVTTSHQLSL